MAVPKKGWRRITVDDRTYSWRAIGTDSGIDVVVVTAAAFERGKRAQQLRFSLDYDHIRTPHLGGGFALHQQAAVAPGLIRLAIEHARDLSPPFTGAHDAPDAVLPSEVVATLQASARMSLPLTFRVDDLSGEPTRALIARHLIGMRASSAKCAHALEIDKLRDPEITFWSVWWGDGLAGCGALRHLDARRSELKSMRVADAFLGRGVGRALLEHLIREARAKGIESLWLETRSSSTFIPALRLYESAGFVRCGPFGGYADDPFSVFMTRAI